MTPTEKKIVMILDFSGFFINFQKFLEAGLVLFATLYIFSNASWREANSSNAAPFKCSSESTSELRRASDMSLANENLSAAYSNLPAEHFTAVPAQLPCLQEVLANKHESVQEGPCDMPHSAHLSKSYSFVSTSSLDSPAVPSDESDPLPILQQPRRPHASMTCQGSHPSDLLCRDWNAEHQSLLEWHGSCEAFSSHCDSSLLFAHELVALVLICLREFCSITDTAILNEEDVFRRLSALSKDFVYCARSYGMAVRTV